VLFLIKLFKFSIVRVRTNLDILYLRIEGVAS